MSDLRKHIDLVSKLNEANWWPQKKVAPPPADTSRSPMAYKKFDPADIAARNMPDNFSKAVIDLEQAAQEIKMGRNTDHYLQVVDFLSEELKNQAASAGMEMFVPMLQNIFALSQRGQTDQLPNAIFQFANTCKKHFATL